MGHMNTCWDFYKKWWLVTAAAKSLQSCPTPCDPIYGSPPGSSARGIFQAGALEWGAVAFSYGPGIQERLSWVLAQSFSFLVSFSLSLVSYIRLCWVSVAACKI